MVIIVVAVVVVVVLVSESCIIITSSYLSNFVCLFVCLSQLKAGTDAGIAAEFYQRVVVFSISHYADRG